MASEKNPYTAFGPPTTVKIGPAANIPRYVRMIKWCLLLSAVFLLLSAPKWRTGHGNQVRMEPDTVCYRNRQSQDDMWKKIPNSHRTQLEWTECYNGKLCTRMAVPLDHTSIDGREASIAIVKVPAKVPINSEAYRGPILFNPGGPGGSGVDLIVRYGETFQRVIGEEFDIIGFDPRGVGQSTPGVNVFPDEAEGVAFRLKVNADPLFNTSADAMARLHARVTTYNALAEARTTEAALYVTTAAVARDMLDITKAHGSDKLQYWGFSYGTVLGATYAAMFPDNVGRLIIDGVEDPDDYYSALWSNNLVDTDAAIHEFFKACVEAGPDLCGLHESSADKVQARLDTLLERLKTRPIAVWTNETDSTDLDYGLVDYPLVRRLLFAFLYSPYTPSVASLLSFILNEAEKGNGAPIWAAMQGTQERFSCQRPGPKPISSFTLDAFISIACGDGEKVEDSVEDLEAHMARIAQDSSFAELWAIRALCINRNIRPKNRFTGPFEGNTSHPLLIIGNTADPVTPLRNAHKVAKGFVDSVVLTQNSAGHATLVAASLCTAKAIRAYFREGTLPAPGTVCEVSSKIFGNQFDPLLESLVGEERELMENWNILHQAFKVPKFGLLSDAKLMGGIPFVL